MPSETAVAVLPGALPRWEVVMLQKFDHKMRIDDHDGVSHRLGGLCASTKSWCTPQTDLSDPSAKLTEAQQNENLTPIRKRAPVREHRGVSPGAGKRPAVSLHEDVRGWPVRCGVFQADTHPWTLMADIGLRRRSTNEITGSTPP
jgi:hypothetical protein